MGRQAKLKQLRSVFSTVYLLQDDDNRFFYDIKLSKTDRFDSIFGKMIDIKSVCLWTPSLSEAKLFQTEDDVLLLSRTVLDYYRLRKDYNKRFTVCSVLNKSSTEWLLQPLLGLVVSKK